ncbi:ubiquitin-conjugating enzyme/RWD-like protein [Hysterangium stoloniferum]|nr:ubiquitin-conjugating enzyme/RWD-like protein [Hysterangium stoloniferum]
MSIPTTSNNSGTSTAMLTLAMEYANLRSGANHCPLGIYVVPLTSMFEWDGVLFIHQGYYADSILKFRLSFPRTFPEHAPNLHFVTDVFHPLVSLKDGQFNLSSHFGTWNSKTHVFEILHYIKAAFKREQLDLLQEKDCFNMDAFRLYRDATPSFAALAAQTSALSNSKSALFDRDHPSMAAQSNHGIPFYEVSPDNLERLRVKLGLREWDIEDELESVVAHTQLF